MTFEDKYISEEEQVMKPDAKRITITDEAFAICELIESLANKIERVHQLLRAKHD